MICLNSHYCLFGVFVQIIENLSIPVLNIMINTCTAYQLH